MYEKIKSILEKAMPEDSPDAKNVEIKGNCNFILNGNISAIVLAIMIAGLLFFKSSPLQSISIHQADFFKQSVSKLAVCQQIPPSAIHEQLKKRFNYNSYKHLKTDQYQEIIAVLDNHPCLNK